MPHMPRMLPLLLAVLLATSRWAETVEAAAAVGISFSAPEFPPLVQKWGGVEHLDTPGAPEFEAMSDNAARRTPMVLAVEQLGTTMTDTPTKLFRRGEDGAVVPLLDAPRAELRRRRGGAAGVRTLLQLDGCPTVDGVFAVNSSSVPSPHARYYPMCEYSQLDELAAAFANYSALLSENDGLPTAWSFWPEPDHTIQSVGAVSKAANFERYLDFYTRVSVALRRANRDNKIGGWQLNAANGGKANASKTEYFLSVAASSAREQSSGVQYPMDYFTIQNYQGDQSAHLVANARAALVAGGGGGKRDARRFALTPVVFVRFSEHKTVDPNYDHKSGVTALLSQLLVTADLPDVAYVLAGAWESFFSSSSSSPNASASVAPMVTAALQFWRTLPAFRAVVNVSGVEPELGTRLQGVAALEGNSSRNRQCFVLWSSSDDPEAGAAAAVTTSLFLSLRWPVVCKPAEMGQAAPRRGEQCSLIILTVGPKQKGVVPLLSVPVVAGAMAIKVPALSLVPNGVALACIRGGTDADANADAAGAADARATGAAGAGAGMAVGANGGLHHATFARDDVLVPRGADDTVRPSGMGHWDSYTSTLFVGTEPSTRGRHPIAPPSAADQGSGHYDHHAPHNGENSDGASADGAGAGEPLQPQPPSQPASVAIAGVILRNVSDAKRPRPYALCLAVQLQTADALDAAAAQVALRLDYLDGDRTLQSLSTGTKNVEYPSFWCEGAASVWPVGKGDAGPAATTFAFDAEGQATVCFSNTDCNVCGGDESNEDDGGGDGSSRRKLQPNPNWASVDGGSRRVRVTLALKGALSQPAAATARLSDSSLV